METSEYWTGPLRTGKDYFTEPYLYQGVLLTSYTAPILRDALNDAIESKPETLIVDLTGVTFIDSMMLGVLLSATRRARPNGTGQRQPPCRRPGSKGD